MTLPSANGFGQIGLILLVVVMHELAGRSPDTGAVRANEQPGLTTSRDNPYILM